MPRVSQEYAKLRSRLGHWFAGQPRDSLVIASREADELSATPYWEVRAGFVGDASLGCSGLAVVLRKGLVASQGVYRVDVYEPNTQRQLPPATHVAGRIEYRPLAAGFTYSNDPDATPTDFLYEPQFQAMHHLLDFVDREPADQAAVADWARSYEQAATSADPAAEPFLTLLGERLQGTAVEQYDQRAA